MKKNQSKNNKSKLFATSIAATFAASAIAPIVTSAAVKDFPDVPKTHNYYNAIQDLVSAGVIKGYEDGRFKMEGYVTRAEAAVMISNILQLDKTATTPFTDVKKGMWYESAVNKLYTAGFIKGVTKTTFQPNKTMTRAELAQLIVEAYQVKGVETTLPFNDVKSDKWYQSPIKVLYSQGLIKGITEKTFGPEKNINRGDFAWLLANTDYKLGNTLKPTPVPPKDAKIESIGTVNDIEILAGEKVSLPATVVATYDNKTTKNVEVIWNTDKMDFKEAGIYTITGTIKDTNKTATAKVIVKAKATAVTTISRDRVAFTITPTKEVVKNFTIEVKDNTGKLVEVSGKDLVKGETQVTLMFKTPLTTDPVGVWTVGSVTHNNDAAQNFKDIMKAVRASNPNEVETLKLLKQSGIMDLQDSNIKEYVEKIANDPLNGNLNDIQRIVNQVNDGTISTGDANTAVKAVNDAKDQVQLSAALKNKAFSRVNTDWIVAYNNTTLKGKDSVENVQKEIDKVNITAIEKAKLLTNTVAEQDALTALINTYMANDMIGETKKANEIKASETQSAIFRVKEATTAASVYDALMKVSTLDPIGLPASSLNENLKAEYVVAKDKFAGSINKTTKVTELNNSILKEANKDAEKAALKEIDEITVQTNTTAVKASLQKLATVTSHLGNNGFDISKVKDANLTEYRAALANLTNPTQVQVVEALNSVNSVSNQSTNLDIIKDSAATAVQVRDALTEVARGVQNTTAITYLNQSSEVKIEIAQFVIDNRSNLPREFGVNDAITAIENATKLQAEKVGKFNAIGKLTETVKTQTALENYGYSKYLQLGWAEKINVAEEINKLTKEGTSPAVALDFSGVDAVKTLAQANAYIDAAIAKATGK